MSENFPVVETVFSVQFDPIASMRTAQLGLLWLKYRDRFPKQDERPPLEPVSERFPEPKERVGINLRAIEEFTIPRVWFVAPNGSEMIQVQSDRFIKNWRREGAEQYPRYAELRSRFDRDYDMFLQFLAENEIGAPVVSQCEVTYVNHFVAQSDNESFYGQVDRVFRFWDVNSHGALGRPADFVVHVRFVIPDEMGQPIGRLHADVRPAVRKADGLPMYVMSLTARGQIGTGIEFFDVGHTWVKRGFKQLVQERFQSEGGTN